MNVGIMGAGAIGCYLGGCLQSRDVDVRFVGRERTKNELEASGLTCIDLDGTSRPIPKEKVSYSTDPSSLADREIVLVCVKSEQTAEAGDALAKVLAPKTIVISMQNGMRNADVLRERLHAQIVLGGIVSFNVVSKGNGEYRQATSGPLVIEAPQPHDDRVTRLATAFASLGFEMQLAPDIRATQWSKLVMNLNNAISALTDRPTKELVFQPDYRRILAALVSEAIDVLKKSKTRTERLGPMPVSFFPFVLGLPNPLLRIVAAAQIKIDPQARSSMWEDLERRRNTEVDHLNGEIVRLAESYGGDAPLNRRVVQLVHEVEAKREGSPRYSADELWSKLHAR